MKQPSIPVFYINKDEDSGEGILSQMGKGPQYPTLKVNVSIYQKDVADILEESMEEKNRESLNLQRQSNLNQRLSNRTNNRLLLDADEENLKMININVDELEEDEESLLNK